MQKLSRTRRRSADILSVRQASSTQLSVICATDFPGYLAYKVLGVTVLDILHIDSKAVYIFNFERIKLTFLVPIYPPRHSC